jgi:acetoin utilization protein AcuB
MLVSYHMTKEPITVDADDLLSHAAHKMWAGGFRRLPVMSDGKLVGIITDRNLREHRGQLDRTKVNGVMSEAPVLTVRPETTLEQAAQIMLEQQIGGLPVVHEGRLVGIITSSDVMRAFLDAMAASNGGSTRIDFIESKEHGLMDASRIVAREGNELLGVGTYHDKFGENPICYLRLPGDAENIAEALRVSGFDVLGVHRIGGELK